MSIEETVSAEVQKLRAKIFQECALGLRERATMHARQRDEIVERGGSLHEAGTEHDRSLALAAAAARIEAQAAAAHSVPVSDIHDEARQAMQAILSGTENVAQVAHLMGSGRRFKKDVALVLRNVKRLDEILRRVDFMLAERG